MTTPSTAAVWSPSSTVTRTSSASRCTACDTHVFPPQPACPRCGADDRAVALPDRRRAVELDGAAHPAQAAISRAGAVRAVRRRLRRRRAGAGRDAASPAGRRARGRSATRCGSPPAQPDDDGDVWSYRVRARRRGLGDDRVDRRRRAAPVRAVRHQRPRDGLDRRARGARRRRRQRGATSTSPPAAAATAATPRRSSASSA